MKRTKKRSKRGASASRRRGAAGVTRRGDDVLRARDLMTDDPVTVGEEITIGELCDLLQERNINGAPVVDRRGHLVGVVTQEDIIYGAMGHLGSPDVQGTIPPDQGRRQPRKMMKILRERALQEVPAPAQNAREKPFWADTPRERDPMGLPVRAIMTSPAISADETTPVGDLCRVMWNLKIHRVPILKNGRVTGLVSAMDLCRAILEGTIRI
jgi:CBS domain-containing protein